MRNANDAISMLQAMEGGLGDVSNILQRGRELSLQAANGTLSRSNRQSLQSEMDQLLFEVDRIGNSTEFNSIKVFGQASNAQSVIINSETQ
ncbi:MAG: hypothetical protein ACE5EH_05270 [Gammaproteobacteria bacterium]